MDRRHQAPHKAHDQNAAPDPEVLRLIGEVESQLQGLKRVHAEREHTKSQLDQLQAELEARAKEQEARAKEHAELEARLAAREREAAAAADDVRQRKAEVEKLAAELAKIESDSKDRIARAAEERQAVESIATDLAQREKSLADRSARFDQLQAEVRALKHRLAETERTAAERAQEILRAHDDAADLARRLHDAEQGRPAAEKQVAAVRAELEKALQAAQKAEADLSLRTQALAELDERCRGLEMRLAEQEQRHSATSESTSELQAKLDAGAQALASATAERDRAQAEIATLQKQGAELHTRLADAAKELKKTIAGRDEATAALARTSEYSKELTAKVAALEEQAEGLRRQAASRAKRADQGMQVRRERMQRCRMLLRERAGKIRQASEMLKARHQQYEQVLSLRGEVITAKRAVDAMQKRVQGAAARTRASAAIFYLAGLIAVLGALSWTVTRQLVPATFAARAVIVPESKARTLSDVELADWQVYHENLLGDPQFLELAAERMGRRGVITMATPGDLRAELEKSFDFQSARDGHLELELRGLGADRTERILDTYVTALVSQANAGKERRTDGASTTILTPAKADVTPIEDPRPVYAAAILGGSTLVSLLIGGIIWGRLAAAKAKFETESRIDEFVESPDWPTANAAG
jgi:hypothetical protein